MHLTRAESTKKLPIPRKGTKYLARPSSHVKTSVSVLFAVRDMLKLARTAKEVNSMIHHKQLKLNGREVKDPRESIKLFNVLEAGKHYILSLTKNGKFKLDESKEKERLLKVIGKKILNHKKTQINFHDGSNVLSEEKIKMGDSVYLDFSGKIKKTVSLSAGKKCSIVSGKYIGQTGKIESVEGKKVVVNIEDKSVFLNERSIFVI